MSKSFDQDRAERAISELLAALGEDLERDGLRDTPKRVARALKENFQGLYQDPKDVLTTTFAWLWSGQRAFGSPELAG
jgi:GTP cyclohydrolase I